MKVKELIEKLQKCDQEKEVLIESSYGENAPEHITNIQEFTDSYILTVW